MYVKAKQESAGRFDALRVETSVARRISDGKMLRLIKLWVKAAVVETDECGHRRVSGGKRCTQGTPQGGVASPLLANIYLHRFIKAFRQYGLDRQYGAVLVNYADDFVILCRHGAAEVLKTTRRWMVGIGLALNEEKTRLRNTRCESFDFFGYTSARCTHRGSAVATTGCSLPRRPSPPSRRPSVNGCGPGTAEAEGASRTAEQQTSA